MYEVTVNGEHVASAGTYGAARNVLTDYLYSKGSTDLAQNVEWSDAECMVDYREWNDDATVAIIDYIDED